jgi:hypothetical protein
MQSTSSIRRQFLMGSEGQNCKKNKVLKQASANQSNQQPEKENATGATNITSTINNTGLANQRP